MSVVWMKVHRALPAAHIFRHKPNEKSKFQASCIPEKPLFFYGCIAEITNLTYDFFYTCDGISCFSADSQRWKAHDT